VTSARGAACAGESRAKPDVPRVRAAGAAPLLRAWRAKDAKPRASLAYDACMARYI
jgi:hypothetical protein